MKRLALLLALAACGEEAAAPAFQTSLSIIDGDGQIDTVAKQLAQPVVAQATDKVSAQPLPQIVLNWYRVVGTDTVFMAAGITNDSGIGRYRPTLGTKAGDQGIIAWALDNDGSRAEFANATATAVAAAPISIDIVPTDTLRVYASTLGSDTLEIELKSWDTYANASPPCNALVWYSADSARVRPLGGTAVRNSLHYARFFVNFSLGGPAMRLRVTASCGGADSLVVQTYNQ